VHVDESFGTQGDYAKAEAVENLLDPKTWTWTPTDLLFLEVLKEAKKLGIRVILDGVFNHVGTAHPAFRDVQAKHGGSAYKDWFSIRSWEPFEYDGWAGFLELPVFRKNDQGFTSDEVKQHIFNVTRRWMDPNGDGDPSDGIDGWRLDVPNEVAMPFWFEWRALVKSMNPDAYIVGEIWKRADQWLDGRSFDAVMNYPFAETIIQWIRDRNHKINVSEMDRRLAELRRAYPAESTYVLQNLVDSHDTDRLVSKMRHPDSQYDKGNREQENPAYLGGKPSSEEYRKARLIALVQMVYVGAPMVYYGDEVGMWGADDPTNRKPMLWKDLEPYEKSDENFVDEVHLDWYRRIISLRQAHPALRRGSFETVLNDDAQDTWIFLRSLAGENILVAINASSNEVQIDLSHTSVGTCTGHWQTIFGGEGASVSDDQFPRVSVSALSGRVWILAP
jgi:glycosidase